jgi:hypothetical protein
MNDAQKVALERIKDMWAKSGCPHQVEENGDMVYAYPLKPSLEPNGTAIEISPDGKTDWVRREPRINWAVESPKPEVCEVEGCNNGTEFFPYSEKLRRKIGLCEVHFKWGRMQGFFSDIEPLLPK